jgi:hypothetical protein
MKKCSVCKNELTTDTAGRSALIYGGRCRVCDAEYRRINRSPTLTAMREIEKMEKQQKDQSNAIKLESLPGYIDNKAIVLVDLELYRSFVGKVYINTSLEPEQILANYMQSFIENNSK